MSKQPTVPHQSFAALRHPGYRAYFLTTALAMMADSIEHVISYWIMFQKFHSPALALLFAAGFLELSFNAMAQTLVQLDAPVQARGRVVGLFNMFGLGLRAFSGVTVGIGGSLIGIHWSLALSATALLAITMGLLAFTMRGRAAAAHDASKGTDRI